MPPRSESAKKGPWGQIKEAGYKKKPVLDVLSASHFAYAAMTAIPAMPFVTQQLEHIGVADGPATWAGGTVAACVTAGILGTRIVAAKGGLHQIAASLKGKEGFRAKVAAFFNGSGRDVNYRADEAERSGYQFVRGQGAAATEVNNGIQSYASNLDTQPDWSAKRLSGWNEANEREINLTQEEFKAWCKGANAADPTTQTELGVSIPGVTDVPDVATLQAAPNAPPAEAGGIALGLADAPTGPGEKADADAGPEADAAEPDAEDPDTGPEADAAEPDAEDPDTGPETDAEEPNAEAEAEAEPAVDEPEAEAEPAVDEPEVEAQDPGAEEAGAEAELGAEEPDAEAEPAVDEPEAEAQDPGAEEAEAEAEPDAEEPDAEAEPAVDEPEAKAQDPDAEEAEAEAAVDEPEAEAQVPDVEEEEPEVVGF